MKKITSWYMMIFLLIALSTGCSESHSQIKVGTPISFEGLEVRESGNADYIPVKHLADIQEAYTLDRTIVFRGIIEGLRTPIELYDKWEDKYLPEYCETKLRVLQPLYGDIRQGDIITHREDVKVFESEGEIVLQTNKGISFIEDNKEYIFILFKIDKKSSEDEPLYDGFSADDYFNEVADYDTYKAEALNTPLSEYENFGYEVLDYYLNQPETKLDLQKEAMKYAENIPEGATEAEILQALPEEQKELFDRMINQYGTITAEKNKVT